MNRLSDVLVVGGGAIGGSIALALAGRGVSVTVVEARRIGRAASWAAAGVLAPEWSGGDPPALRAMVDDALAAWPAWSRLLEERSGVGLSYHQTGLLNLWIDPEAPELPTDLETEIPPRGGGKVLSPGDVRLLEPELTGPVMGAIYHPGVAQVDNTQLAAATLQAAARQGARILTDTHVAALLGQSGRCTGVRTAAGVELGAGAVIMAAGAWSGLLAECSGVTLPMEPWRGQMLLFDAPARPLRHIVFCGELILVPRPHGPLIVGTTLENVGFDERVTWSGIHDILSRASRLAPGLGDLPLARTWAGLRPGTPDHLPYMGKIPGWEGLYAATGHGRKGIILASIAGELMARLVLENDLDPRLIPCLPDRLP